MYLQIISDMRSKLPPHMFSNIADHIEYLTPLNHVPSASRLKIPPRVTPLLTLGTNPCLINCSLIALLSDKLCIKRSTAWTKRLLPQGTKRTRHGIMSLALRHTMFSLNAENRRSNVTDIVRSSILLRVSILTRCCRTSYSV